MNREFVRQEHRLCLVNFDDVIIEQPEIKEVKVNPNQDLLDLGFDFEILPSGKTNIKNKHKFRFNDLMGTYKSGQWFFTIDASMKDFRSKIISLDFVED